MSDALPETALPSYRIDKDAGRALKAMLIDLMRDLSDDLDRMPAGSEGAKRLQSRVWDVNGLSIYLGVRFPLGQSEVLP